MVQAKAPGRVDIHIAYLRHAAGAADEYKVQVQGELWVCEKAWNHVISYYPGLPDAEFRMERDDDFITDLAAHVRAFSGLLEEKAEDFKSRGWIRPKEETAEAEPFLTKQDIEWALGREL